MADPARFLRRSPLRRAVPATAEWRALSDAAIVGRIVGAEAIGTLAIADLSPLPRLGFKGKGTIPAMQARGLAVEAEANRAFRQEDGSLCLVLGAGEVFLLESLEGNGARLSDLEAGWRLEDEERTYPVPRRDSHAWLAVVGTSAPEMFAKLCAVDLRLHKFADLAIAQTSVARLNAIVVRADLGAIPMFHLLADSASSAYLLACLLDAAGEFGGGMVGLDTLLRTGGQSDGER